MVVVGDVVVYAIAATGGGGMLTPPPAADVPRLDRVLVLLRVDVFAVRLGLVLLRCVDVEEDVDDDARTTGPL